MKKIILISFIVLLSLTACKEKEAQIISGREWNVGRNVVADTTSAFLHWDPFIVQLDYGKNFDFDSLKCEITDESGKVRYSKMTAVSPKMGSYTLQGKKKGSVMTIGDFLRSKKPQTAKVRFFAKDSLIVEKDIQVIAEK
ncbi:MAG: hypothetical protein UIH18_04390 [Fibrobacteraceae bacterium]|nr:hypothetical protein [Fibrobacteraceae bacterium]